MKTEELLKDVVINSFPTTSEIYIKTEKKKKSHKINRKIKRVQNEVYKTSRLPVVYNNKNGTKTPRNQEVHQKWLYHLTHRNNGDPQQFRQWCKGDYGAVDPFFPVE